MEPETRGVREVAEHGALEGGLEVRGVTRGGEEAKREDALRPVLPGDDALAHQRLVASGLGLVV